LPTSQNRVSIVLFPPLNGSSTTIQLSLPHLPYIKTQYHQHERLPNKKSQCKQNINKMQKTKSRRSTNHRPRSTLLLPPSNYHTGFPPSLSIWCYWTCRYSMRNYICYRILCTMVECWTVAIAILGKTVGLYWCGETTSMAYAFCLHLSLPFLNFSLFLLVIISFRKSKLLLRLLLYYPFS
jgi:hypothetical protein